MTKSENFNYVNFFFHMKQKEKKTKKCSNKVLKSKPRLIYQGYKF